MIFTNNYWFSLPICKTNKKFKFCICKAYLFPTFGLQGSPADSSTLNKQPFFQRPSEQMSTSKIFSLPEKMFTLINFQFCEKLRKDYQGIAPLIDSLHEPFILCNLRHYIFLFVRWLNLACNKHKVKYLTNLVCIKSFFFRCAGQKKRSDLWVLSRALPRHNFHNQDQEKDTLLLLQPDSSLCAHCLHGCSRLHPAPRLGGEAVPRWRKITEVCEHRNGVLCLILKIF